MHLPSVDDTQPEAISPSGEVGGDEVIRLENISVRYRVPDQRITSFKEYLIRRVQGQLGYTAFWALQGVSLTVRQGEVLGIVGRNGAGKSTLLKVIARVLRPTTGRVWIRGRVVPLLEVGAAFHDELTGRENVYLNATLLGHPRREIDARFADIVDFAELWDFIDAPLRTYSSGMAARLGFAIALAWEPDILLLDEILAVGDERFQQKCLARLDAYRREGAAILLVSHSSERIRATCQRAIWLEYGRLRAVGPPDDVLGLYSSCEPSCPNGAYS